MEQGNPGEEVKLIELSAEADQQRTALVNAARINSNAYDVVSLDNVWVSEFAANRWVVELPQDELKNDDILEPVWKTGVYKDKLFAVPFVTDAPVMFYRKDFLAKAGVAVPKTWDEVKAAIDKVRALPEHKDIGGFGGQFAKYEGLTCCASEFIHTPAVASTTKTPRSSLTPPSRPPVCSGSSTASPRATSPRSPWSGRRRTVVNAFEFG